MKYLISLLFITSTIYAQDIYATFSIEAKESANLAFNATGLVESVEVEVGSVLKQGQIIATLKHDDLQALLESARINLKYAKKDYERQLAVKHVIDKSKLDLYEKNYESAKANVAYQKALLDKSFLKAPFEGIILTKNVEKGDVVSAQNGKVLFTIQSLHDRKLILSFDQKYHAKVKAGDTFEYTIDGDNQTYNGTITKIYPYADTATRKIKAEVLSKDTMTGLFGQGYIKSKD
jgi:RND family efflux transporter MFP subunit